MYIVGCQMPEDDFFIRDYVKQLLAEQADNITQVVSAELMLSGDTDKHVRYNNAQITKKGSTRQYPPC